MVAIIGGIIVWFKSPKRIRQDIWILLFFFMNGLGGGILSGVSHQFLNSNDDVVATDIIGRFTATTLSKY